MKLKCFLIILAGSFVFKTRSQVYTAGNSLGNYTDINPDTVINYPFTGSFIVETYSLSMFGINDVEITAFRALGSPGNLYNRIFIYSPNPSIEIGFKRWDSLYQSTCNCWNITMVSKIYSINDTLNKPANVWKNGTLYITENSQHPGGNKVVSDWVGASDKYVGFKFQNAFATEYGWLRISVPSHDKCILKDYSSSSITTAVKDNEVIIGQSVYPNPFSNEIYFEGLQNEKIQLFDYLSREINVNYENQGNRVRLIFNPELPQGIYYLKISGKDGTYCQKLIKS